MKGRNSKTSGTRKGSGPSLSLGVMLWAALISLTVLRIMVATGANSPGFGPDFPNWDRAGGTMTEGEALILACAAHPAGGYVEGPAGVPLLLSILHLLGGSGPTLLRWISPLLVLALSWTVWWIARRVAPHRPAVALWSVLGFNLLPPVNLASLVMNGAAVTATLLMLAAVAGWHAVQGRGDGRKALTAWALFGGLLGLGTLFCYPVGILLPAALVAQLVMHGVKSFPWRGVTATLSLLILGWVFPVAWNARHDWIQWSSISPGFDPVFIGSHSFSLGLAVALCAAITPLLVWMAFARKLWRLLLIPVLLLLAISSGIYLLMPGFIPAGLPSPLGLSGLRGLSGEILSLRGSRPDARGGESFLIASTPGLAALLGSAIQIDYPERPGSPSVFAVESPSMSSSFALWPGYADAVAAGVKDPLYTEEKSVSPFLGRNALYITTESKEELPQTITGAFGAVGLLKEVPVTLSGRPVTLRIYQCEGYRTLSL